MADGSESENNIIKHVAKEICRECSDIDLEISQQLAEYMVRMKLLNPKNGFTAERVMPRNLTQKLISGCVQDLSRNTPATDAIKLQIYWNCNPINFTRQNYDAIVTKNSETILKEILESKHQIQDKDKILKKITGFIVTYSGVGNPNLVHVMRETKAALQSVFKPRDIQQFMAFTNKEKIEKLENLTRIVVGIRLHHKNCGFVKDGIDDLPVLLSQGVESIRKRIENSLVDASEKINFISHGLKALYAEDGWVALPQNFDRQHLETCKDVLIIMLQYETYFRELSTNLEQVEAEIDEIKDKYQVLLQEIQEKVKNRMAIPTSDIYPKFIELGNVWVQFKIKIHYLIQLNSAITNLNSINKYFEVKPFEAAINALAQPEPEKRFEAQQIQQTEDMHPDVEVLSGDQSKDFKIQFEGFCSWTLSQTQGFLLPGNPKIGLVRYRDLIYAFSSTEAAREWSKDPELHVKRALYAGRNKPALVQFLGIYEHLLRAKHLPLIEESKTAQEIKDARVQTEIHPVKAFLDKDYAFSEWELKRRALQLSRIIKCRTKSQQTLNHSTWRAFIGTQTVPAKHGFCQTTKDDSCVTPAPARYIWGLRGLPGDQVKDFSLVPPLHRTPCSGS